MTARRTAQDRLLARLATGETVQQIAQSEGETVAWLEWQLDDISRLWAPKHAPLTWRSKVTS